MPALERRPVTFEQLPDGHCGLVSGRPDPDLAAHGYVEREYVASGVATAYRGAQPGHGRWSLEPDVDRGEAEFTTRVVVRRPVDAAAVSGAVVVEWLNVSSGTDAAPEWTYLADELLRRGHVWVGVSAQHVGVEGGDALVGIGGMRLPALKEKERYVALRHPGDAWCYGMYDAVAAGLAAPGGPLAGVDVEVLLAVGESQSAYALTTFYDGVQPLTGTFDGFLVHSRGGAAMTLGEPGRGIDLAAVRDNEPCHLRDDLGVPAIMVQAETDLLGRLRYLAARQPDAAHVRVWEVAGTAHADRYIIGEAEPLLGCTQPVNRGQMAYVVRAALRHLEAWARSGTPAPAAARTEVVDGAFALDDLGNTRGGVRTPVVDVAVERLHGDTDPGASPICDLFGSTRPIEPALLRATYPDADDYLARYAAATDAAIAAGFVLAEDRDAVLADARPHLVDAALGKR